MYTHTHLHTYIHTHMANRSQLPWKRLQNLYIRDMAVTKAIKVHFFMNLWKPLHEMMINRVA